MSSTATSARVTQDPAAMPWASMLLDAGGHIRRCGRRAASIFGRRAEQLIGWPIQALIPALPLQPATLGYNLAFVTFWRLDRDRPQLWGVDHKGDRFALDVELCLSRCDSGHAFTPQFRLSIRTRSLRPRPERGESDFDRYLRAVEDQPEGVVLTDVDGSIVRANRSAERMIGRPSETLAGVALRQVFAAAPGVTPRSSLPAVWTRTDGDGTCTHVEATTRPFVDRFGVPTHYVYTLRDVSERECATERLARMVQHDHLTGLPNRSLFEDRLQQAMARFERHGTGFALLYLDIDRFKSVNDLHGHAAGDKVLRRVARRLLRTVRAEDTVARIGGDEFAVLLSGSSLRGEVESALDAILVAVGSVLRLPDGTLYRPSASIGIACCPHDAVLPHALIQLADAAMYGAKRAGGHRARFSNGSRHPPGAAGDRPSVVVSLRADVDPIVSTEAPSASQVSYTGQPVPGRDFGPPWSNDHVP